MKIVPNRIRNAPGNRAEGGGAAVVVDGKGRPDATPVNIASPAPSTATVTQRTFPLISSGNGLPAGTFNTSSGFAPTEIPPGVTSVGRAAVRMNPHTCDGIGEIVYDRNIELATVGPETHLSEPPSTGLGTLPIWIWKVREPITMLPAVTLVGAA